MARRCRTYIARHRRLLELIAVSQRASLSRSHICNGISLAAKTSRSRMALRSAYSNNNNGASAAPEHISAQHQHGMAGVVTRLKCARKRQRGAYVRQQRRLANRISLPLIAHDICSREKERARGEAMTPAASVPRHPSRLCRPTL